MSSTPTTPSYATVCTEPTQEEINAAYEDALDDVHTRFLLNLPEEELGTSDRIFFQLEQAWWFYDDFYCDHSKIPLPRFKNVRSFAIKMFDYSPLLQPLQDNFDTMWCEFSAYKRKISTYGTFLLNQACNKIALCQVYKSDTWTTPAGKINQNEHGIDAAARETYEETGFDPNCLYGKTKQMKETGVVTWKPLQDEDSLVFVDAGKRRTCYVCRGVPQDFSFLPVARKEVSQIKFFDLDNLPKKTFAVLPFMKQLRRWIRENGPKKKKGRDTPNKKRSGSANKKRSGSSGRKSRNNSRGKVRENDPLTETGLATPGESSGWTEDDMFKANERLLGRKVEYDGNPHLFASEAELDPHAFHVVGGSFMNSGGITKLAPAPTESKLQPLFRRDDVVKEDEGLQPFFSNQGETPWGDVVASAWEEEARDSTPKRGKKKSAKQQETTTTRADAGQALLNMLHGSSNDAANDLGVFMTDADITAKSQKEKSETPQSKKTSRRPQSNVEEMSSSVNEEYVRQWVQNLPKAPATERFGDFRFDVDRIMDAMNLKAG